MPKEIKHKWFYSQSPEKVWEYLTKAELIGEWLMDNDFLPIVGYDFQFRTKPLPDYDFDGIVFCKVLEIISNKKLCYSWKCGPGNGKITLDSIVEWTLAAKDNGTELSLKHTGFREIENFSIFSIMDSGWLKNMQKIAQLLNNAKHDTTNS